MKRWLVGAVVALCSMGALALEPYLSADKVAGGNLKAAMSAVEQKLAGGGFTVIGRHVPKGMSEHGALVATDAGLTAAALKIGGKAVIFVPIRVGVQADGSVSVVNLEYWGRAYLRGDYGKAEAAIKAAQAKLQTTLGAGKPFGGDVAADDLASYRYMFGMERFDDDKTTLMEHKSFDEALKAVRANLAKGVKGTAKVYEIVLADKKLAVFGVSLGDAEYGEGWWVNKIGADNIAGLPWEVFVVDGKVMGLYGRYRTALAWPSLGMGQFMGISSHPDTTLEMLQRVAGTAE